MSDASDLIKNVLFIKIGGIPLIYLRDIGEDTSLISGYLEAFKNFSSELENAGEIRSINLSKITFSYFSNNPEFYIISINDSRVPIDRLTLFLEELQKDFLEKYSIEDIKYWNRNTNYFQSFLPYMIEKINDFAEKITLKLECELNELLNIDSQEIFNNPNNYAIIITDSSSKNIKSFVNPSLKDFELQVFIASPYFNRVLVNFIPTLANTGNILLNSKGLYYILKSQRFYLGMKTKDSSYVGILGADLKAIEKILTQI
ncbi:MAG: hypothetical protein ACTSO9_01450 [Candidatus Helarchaeota archaeon]